MVYVVEFHYFDQIFAQDGNRSPASAIHVTKIIYIPDTLSTSVFSIALFYCHKPHTYFITLQVVSKIQPSSFLLKPPYKSSFITIYLSENFN